MWNLVAIEPAHKHRHMVNSTTNHKVSYDKISLEDTSDYIHIYDKQHNEFTDTS